MIREYRFFGQLAGERELGFDELRDGQEDGVQCLAFLMDLEEHYLHRIWCVVGGELPSLCRHYEELPVCYAFFKLPVGDM